MKKIILILIVLLVLFSVSFVNAQAQVNTLPNSISIPRDRQTTRSITWDIEMSANFYVATSNVGTFYNFPVNPTITLGTINKTVSAPLSYNPVTGQGEGSAKEVLTIPLGVIKNAEKNGLATIYYRRTFNDSFSYGYVTIRLQTVAGGELLISRMRLYFENKRGEITVDRNEKGLKTFADISYTGKGLFKGYWEVDNRIISYVNKHLVYGRKLIIETPDIPDLPTFSEGTHTVKFIIQSPAQGVPMPKAIYYVRPFEAIKIVPIAQISPYNRAPVDYSSFTFKWGIEDDLTTYLLEFTDDSNKTPVFSAYIRNAEYVLPPYVLKYYFKAGKRYFWRVKGFDSKDNIAGESDVREFRFKSD